MIRHLQPLINAQNVAAHEWFKANAPLIDAAARMSAFAAKLMPSPGMQERLAWLRREEVRCEAIEATGWMAHPSTPFHLHDDDGLDGADLAGAIEVHYRLQWASVSSGMQGRVDACSIDDEAKAAYAEALAAHGAGLFRCAPRVLFPELERVARIELHDGVMEGLASQRLLREAMGGLTPAQMDWSGSAGLRFYRKLTEHVYASLKDPAAMAKAVADPVPNRHAALHGFVSYATAQSSFNALAGAEYMLMAISALKEAVVEDQGAPTHG